MTVVVSNQVIMVQEISQPNSVTYKSSTKKTIPLNVAQQILISEVNLLMAIMNLQTDKLN